VKATIAWEDLEIGVLPNFGGVEVGCTDFGAEARHLQVRSSSGGAPTNDLISSRSYLFLRSPLTLQYGKTRPLYSDFCVDGLLLAPGERSPAIGSI